jgi:hypothetical protein
LDFSDLYNWEALEYYLNFGQSLGDFAGMHGEDDDEDGEGSNSDDDKPAKKAVKPAAGGAAPQGGADGKQ